MAKERLHTIADEANTHVYLPVYHQTWLFGWQTRLLFLPTTKHARVERLHKNVRNSVRVTQRKKYYGDKVSSHSKVHLLSRANEDLAIHQR